MRTVKSREAMIKRFLGISLILFVLFLGISLWGTFAIESLQPIDEWISLEIFSWRQPFLTELASILTSFFDFEGQLIITLGLMFIFCIKKDWKVSLWYGIGVLFVAYFLNRLAKNFFTRPRPHTSFHLIDQGGLSFPSGHAMGVTIIIGLAVFICYYYGSHILSKSVAALGGLLILTVGMTRVYLGVHYFSDIIGGFTLAGASVFFWAAVFVYWEETTHELE